MSPAEPRKWSPRRLWTIAAVATVTAIALTACTGNADPAPTSETRNFGADQSYDLPPKGNYHTLTGVSGSIPTNLGYLRDLILLPGAIYEWDAKEYYYLLADESSGLSEDGTVFEYRVRDGLTWSDGSDVTAQDVYATFALRYPGAHPVFKYVDSIELVDDSTVRFHMPQPAPIAEYWILRERPASAAQYAEVVPEAEKLFAAKAPLDSPEVKALSTKIAELDPEAPVVSGPFNIDVESPTNSQLMLVRNDLGYKADTVGFDTITVYNGSTETITPLVLSGDVNYATDGFPVATTKQFEKEGYQILRPPTYTGPGLYFNYNAYPEFSDERVRQAFAYFLDRDRMGELALGESGKGVRYMAGISDVAVGSWVPEEDQSSLVAYDLDVEKATDLLLEAGWTKDGDTWVTSEGTPAKYDLVFPADYVDWASVGQDLAAQATEFGIQITPVGIDSSQQEVDVQEGRFQLAIQGWGASNPFPTDAYIAALFTFNTPTLGEGMGMGFPMVQETESVGTIDLEAEVNASGFGTEDELKDKTARLALAFNELLPVLPLVERYANNPVVTDKVAGFPAEGDPLYQNSIYSDNFVPIFMYEGMLSPK